MIVRYLLLREDVDANACALPIPDGEARDAVLSSQGKIGSILSPTLILPQMQQPVFSSGCARMTDRPLTGF